MAGGSDQLHAALEGLMIRFRSDESGKKRMVDIDHAQQVLGDEVRSQDLHIAREHDQVDVLPEQFKHLPLGLALIFGVSQQMERDMMKVGHRLKTGSVRWWEACTCYDQRNSGRGARGRGNYEGN
jgi:hypothetical protein